METVSAVIIRKPKKKEKSTVAPPAAPVATVATKTAPLCPSSDTASSFSWTEAPFTILESYFQGHYLDRLVRHQIESYNYFVTYQVQRTIQMFNPIVVRSEQDYLPGIDKYALEIEMNLDNFKLLPPLIHENNGASKLMFPQEARLRNFTYAGTMNVDVQIKYTVRELGTASAVDPCSPPTRVIHKTLHKINLGKLPIMLKSAVCLLTQNSHLDHRQTGECEFDCGGYFIISGSEKTVLAQERAAENKIYCFRGKVTSKWAWFAEIKSVPDNKFVSPKQIEVMLSNKTNGFGRSIYVHVPRVKVPVELFVLFRALGVQSDQDICEHILLDMNDPNLAPALECLRASIHDGNRCMSRNAALSHIASHVTYIPPSVTAAPITSIGSKEEDPRESLAARKREFTAELLMTDLFPHCRTLAQKIYFLGYMTKLLIFTALGWLPQDDRDAYSNKRIELTGTLLNNLFRNHLNKLVKEMQKQCVREINLSGWKKTMQCENIVNKMNIYKILKPTTIENGIKRALSTGDFSIKQTNSSKVGVAQVLNRMTYASSLSHLRRISTPLDKSGELVAPRKLHNTTWGYLCPPETPEGSSIGVVKNLAYMTHVTIPSSSSGLYSSVEPFIIPLSSSSAEAAAPTICPPRALIGKVKVFVNGNWVGVTDHPMELYADLKKKKCSGSINIYTSVAMNYRMMELRVCNDGGRLTRPVLRVVSDVVGAAAGPGAGTLLTAELLGRLRRREIQWNDLLGVGSESEAVIEYIDPEEQNLSTMIAMTHHDLFSANEPANPHKTGPQNARKRYTHCEIHPSTIFGVLASCIPFPEHNQSPRNCYQVAMSKQSIGIYATNFDQRMDKTAYVLAYPMRPLVDTRVMNFIKLNRIPSGSQVIVAIMTHTGYNQEDSILMNKGSVDRGLFMATIYHSEKDENKKNGGEEPQRCRPDPTKTKNIKFGDYSKVGPHGFMPENTLVCKNDVIMAKVVPMKENRNDPTKVVKFEDQSRVYKTDEETYLDKNYVGRNGDGYNFAKMRLRTLRLPGIGDKFASRAGQKGTVGNIIPEEDMPYTREGVRPDLIINPHAIPSRMTIAQLKECLLSKVLVHLGIFGDGTAFGELSVKDHICEYLRSIGYESHGNEVMYNGLTGEQLEANIFIGPTFYQRLKHMVNDKVHARATGPCVLLTRQPTEGRSKGGALRLGEMERDCLISGGYTHFIRERFYSSADKYAVHICRQCGLIAAFNNRAGIHLCRVCENRTDFAYVEIPYAMKLMMQELLTINIATRFITD